MSTVLCLSSQVARGFVGGTAARTALERLGHDCWLLPTVILSNHPGHARFAGEQVPVGRLRAMLEALEANGWLEEIDAVLTGYMPSAEHVELAARALEMVRAANPDVTVLCDPIIGDAPGGLYVEEDVAGAVRDELVPLARIATPNRFELEWLTGRNARSVNTALAAARELGPRTVLVTSVRGGDAQTLVNVLADERVAFTTAVPRRKDAPHGAGDLMAALFLGHVLNGSQASEALARATGSVEDALEESAGAGELRLAAAPGWLDAGPWPLESLSVA